MVPVYKDLGGMAACGQEVAPTTLTPCHLHDGAGGHSKCLWMQNRGPGSGFGARGAPPREFWPEDTGLVGALLYFRTTQK